MSTDAIRQRLLTRFREVTGDRVERLAAALRTLEDGPDAGAVQELLRELHTLKGEARMMGFAGLSTLVHAAEEHIGQLGERLPSRAALIRRVFEGMPRLLEFPGEGDEEGARLARELEALLAGGDEPREQQGASGGGEASDLPKVSEYKTNTSVQATQASSIRVDLDSLDAIAGLAGDVLVEGARARARAGELEELLESWPRLAQRLLAIAEGRQRQASAAGGAVDTLDRAAGDFHRLRTRTFRFFHHHTEALDGSRQLASSLAEEVASARLLPLENVFSGLTEAAARMAREQGKELECAITGGDAGIDRAILPSLSDPLIHLIRNCVDHGLETPEHRRAAGKSPKGKLRISARPDGDRLRVVVEDDGKGIDAEMIRAAARRRGLLDEVDGARLSERAVIDLIFASGFTTLENTSEISGRGVGLDVVRERVVSLGGTVEVETELGVGTRFILTLPQSLSLMKVLLVRIDEDVYGIPAGAVDAVGRIEPGQVQEIGGVRTARHRDRSVPIVALGPLLSLNGGPREVRPLAAFLRVGELVVALVVDGIFGQREVAVKAPSAFIKGMRFVSGAAALEDGRVALLLSTAELIEAARAFGAPTSQALRRRLKVLLVDDSLIAREAEAAILRSLGHEVSEAADGEEGWLKLQAGAFDLLVTDVQMPLLDGIELTRRVKQHEELRRLPVAIVSSLASAQDRRRGSEAGADAFLSKAELDGDVLGETIERLCGAGG